MQFDTPAPLYQKDDAAKLWETALGALECSLSRPNFRTWYSRTVGLTWDGRRFTVGVPNSFVAEYLEQNQRSLIEKTLLRLLNCGGVQVIFQVAAGGKPTGHAPRAEPSSIKTSGGHFNPRYDFETFIVGNTNRLAHAAALSAAQKPGEGYNPLFIHGGSGLGKTHLLQAIGQLAERSGKSVRYVSGEQFTSEFISSLKERRAEEFRERYRAVDLLLVDDVQFLAGKTQTEECFFHTFNELHNSCKQIVLSADSPPRAISQMEDRLRSRFEWGLTAEITPPDEKMRLAILKARTDELGAEMPPDVLEYLASEVTRNIRELEGNLNRVLAYARLLRSAVTPDMARRALKNIAPTASVQEKPSEPQLLLAAVAECFGLAPEDLLGRKRDKETAMARQVAMFVMKNQNIWSMAEIGKLVGDRAAATVSHACEKISQETEYNPLLKRKIIDIESRLGKE
ncbi:chromosomal replication initiator protein DnaA [Dehalogenimonas alkenigignens]|uniref:Chromosomal replication initiator protein DnaA n=1 Tax=Dehalogenimonas alkenigignens TaxID=1217799 RepID=A0A0W0GHB7_9CHLR|nr:chromosomal replication initiator protein DnaA [Dehalogenimonas alkenigignens]KTB47947.1 chromosomal replication initiator protein DnaA [Dehalogenimonas alkenigignens]PVV82477.1 chromosomal replication initiator protein DnaA [Dehalogenimonas alkenigignens]